jgi:hypothetical protein
VRRFFLIIGSAAAIALAWGPSALAAPQTLYSCGPGAGTGDGTDRGFYITGYPGPNLHSVTLAYEDDVAGIHTIGLTAHLGAYDGPVVGSATVTGTVTDTGFTPLTFTFTDPSVAAGSTIAFVQQVITSPPGSFLFYDYTADPCPGVIETEGTSPPLDTPRTGGRGIATTITSNPPGPSVPGQTQQHKKKCKKHKRGKKASAARKHCKRHKHRAS